MARYFFDMIEGDQTVADDVGTVLESDEIATRFAWRTLAACVSEPGAMSQWQHAKISVRREDGVYVGRVSMAIEVETRETVPKVAVAGPLKVDGGQQANFLRRATNAGSRR